MYLSAFRPGGGHVDRADLLISLARARGLRETDYSVASAGSVAAAVPAGPRPGGPSVVRWNQLFAVGDVRLDNRAELARLAGVPNAGSDLELVVRALDASGEKCIASMLGDFAFLLWDPRAHKLIAARDAFGVKPLYFRKTPDLLLFSDRMDALATEGRYDLEYIGDFLTGMVMPGQRTIWASVREVPAGGFVILRGTVLTTRRYWSAEAFAPQTEADERYNTEQFLTLLRDAVRFRVGPVGATWAQLSGGLDSSAVVALAQNAGGAGQGLAGTITIVDSLGYGDERPYADSVIRRYDLRNEQVHDYWAWQDDGAPPPLTDGPRALYPFYARDRQTADVLRRAGAQVLLSGFGADHYLTGNFNYITDLAARGKVGTALAELTRWSVSNRQSFWRLAHRHLVNPILAAATGGRRKLPALPGWIDARFASERGLAARTVDALETDGRPGTMFLHKLARDVAAIPAWIDRAPFGEDIEIRYPFLYRPLVEAGLQLPPALRIRPEGTKWILREAMRGLLPEDVRTRAMKGSIDARIIWSFQRESARLDQLLRDPILAQLGCISPDELRRDLDAARRGVPTSLVMLVSALSLETWLSVRSGRWTASRARQTAA